MVYDLDGFYDTLSRVAARSYTPEEVERGESFRLMQPYVAQVASPVEIAPAARMIAAATVSDKEFQGLAGALAKAIGGISGDDRSFTSAAAGPQIRTLVEAAQRRHIPSAPLVEAYRLYIVNNMSAARCADDDLMTNNVQSLAFADPRLAEQQGPDPAAYFNARLRVPPLQDIQEQEVTPAKLEGFAVGLRGCGDEYCKAVVAKYLDLILDPGRNAYPPSHKQTPEWQKQFQEFLASVAAWQAAGEVSASAHFREKSALYNDASTVAPDAATRESVLRAQLEFACKARASAENRVQWFLPINALIGRAALAPQELGKLSADLRLTGDPVVTLFAELDAAAPRTPDQILPLL